ncbi:MAG: hypothetical protein WEC75_11495 [Dehalococcoidia bacterium]
METFKKWNDLVRLVGIILSPIVALGLAVGAAIGEPTAGLGGGVLMYSLALGAGLLTAWLMLRSVASISLPGSAQLLLQVGRITGVALVILIASLVWGAVLPTFSEWVGVVLLAITAVMLENAFFRIRPTVYEPRHRQ